MTVDLKALEENFKQLNNQIQQAQKEMQEKSIGFIEAACKQFFEICPQVESVQWTQYTPYFNDGDACEFSVNDKSYVLVGDDEADDYEGSMIYTQNDLDRAKEKLEDVKAYVANPSKWIDNYINDYKNKYGRTPSLRRHYRPYPRTIEEAQERVDEIESFLEKYSPDVIDRIENAFKSLQKTLSLIDDDVMLALYGDHVKVVITRFGTEIDEFDHD